MNSVTEAICDIYRHELDCAGPVQLHAPAFEGREWEYVKECLDAGWVSSAGSFVTRFEDLVARRCGTRYAVATVNGTAALHAALLGVGVGAGDLVACPALTFVGTVNAISYCGADPLFVDSEWHTLGIDARKLQAFIEDACENRDGIVHHRASGRRLAAVIPVHVFGHPVDMDPLMEICSTRGIPVVEDAAEALGSAYKGRPCGGLADAGVVSFNGNKTVTTGGGGMIVTDSADLASHLRHVTTTARTGTGWDFDHDMVGFNYRLPNINAALGCAQMELLDGFLDRKRQLHARLATALAGTPEARLFAEQPWARSNHWLNALIFADQGARDRFLVETNDRDIQTRPCWRLMPDLAPYRDAVRGDDLAVARDIQRRVANVPSGPGLMRPASMAASD